MYLFYWYSYPFYGLYQYPESSFFCSHQWIHNLINAQQYHFFPLKVHNIMEIFHKFKKYELQKNLCETQINKNLKLFLDRM